MEATELCEIMGRNGSDKGHKDINNSHHNYTLVYHNLFKRMKMDKLRIFELGLGTNNPNLPSNMGVNGKPGASLRGWEEYFPNAKIFGADIDKDILFEEGRIKTYYCDQLNPGDIKKMWDEKDLWEPFDIIIEDGLHEPEANICFFENSIHKLKRGGYYIIEDLTDERVRILESKIEQWKVMYPEINFKSLKVPSNMNTWDNSLIICHFDFMNGF